LGFQPRFTMPERKIAVADNRYQMRGDFFAGLDELRIDRDDKSGAYFIRDSRLPWKSNKSSEQKKDLLRRLSTALPNQIVWLDSSFTDIAESLVPCSSRHDESREDWFGWFHLKPDVLDHLVDSSQGGWAIAFASAPFDKAVVEVSPLPMKPSGAIELLTALNGDAIVLSELDEEFWLLTLK
jgi:hypothetical protein